MAGYGADALGVDGSAPPRRRGPPTVGGQRLAAGRAGDPEDWSRLAMVRVWSVWQSADWRPAVLADLRAGAAWDRAREVAAAVRAAAERTRYALKVPPPIAGRLFLRRWRRLGASPEVEMARREFTGVGELGAVVRRLFAHDVQRSRKAR